MLSLKKLNLEPGDRTEKRNKFGGVKYGGVKYVYQPDLMKELKEFTQAEIERKFPQSKILYWT